MRKMSTRGRSGWTALSGFTLIEMMITVVILGIILSIAISSYLDLVRESRRTEAKALLQEVMNREERYYTTENAYTDDLTDLGYVTPLESESNWYQVTASYCTAGDDQCVELTAAPQDDQTNDVCGSFTLDSSGERDKTGSGTCW